MNDLVFASARELAATILHREVSAAEVLEAHLAQIDYHNPQLNVIVTLSRDLAMARAEEADTALARGEVWGPLHGVPITVKDALATAALRTTSGFPPWAEYVPQRDALAVARLRSAGAILLGKTNLPPLSMDIQVENPLFGRTNNPWDLSRTCGGSSGGAAAVAAGLTPLDLGTDIAGSVRIPAHCCGVYGLKPSDYRLPVDGFHPNPEPELPQTGGPAGLGVFGPLARSVDDLILAFQVMAGPEATQWTVPPVPAEPAADRRLEQLRLAWTDDFGGVPVSADTRNTLDRLAKELGERGCRIERSVPEHLDFRTAWETWGEMAAVVLGFDPDLTASLGARADSQAPTSRGLKKGLQLTLREFVTSLRKRSLLIAALEVFFEEWDAFICPVMSVPAFPHCAKDTPILVDGKPVDYWTASIAHACPFNLTGHPVVVLPVGHSSEGLPIGVQVVGKRWGEMHLLGVAKALVEVLGPFQRPPGY
jgi:amidase